jgi:hypothetical protein
LFSLQSFSISKPQVTIVGVDFMINMIFTIVTDRDNKVIQEPYHDEARKAMEGMRRIWQESDPAKTSFAFDLFGGAGAYTPD